MPLVPVFDLGNVLVFVDEPLFFRRLRARCRPGAPLEELFWQEFARAGVDVGGDFDSLHPVLARELGLTMTVQELRLAWCDIFAVNSPMLDVVASTPPPRYLLSTTNEPHVSWLRRHYQGVFDLFDHSFLSCEVGLRKPDRALFRRVESVSAHPPESHLLVDDLPQNVAGAEAAGWGAILFRGPEDCLARLAEAAGRLRVPAERRKCSEPS